MNEISTHSREKGSFSEADEKSTTFCLPRDQRGVAKKIKKMRFVSPNHHGTSRPRISRLPQQLLFLLLFFCKDASASSLSMSRPLPEMDVWFFIAKYIRPEWFQWTLTILIFLIFFILSQLSCLRPADVNQFDRTMKGGPPSTGGDVKTGAPGKSAPPPKPEGKSSDKKTKSEDKKTKEKK